MPTQLDPLLEKWVNVKLIDTETAERIRAYERDQHEKRGSRLPVFIALALGGVMLAAGVLLFVAAHWDTISPGSRFALVVAMVAGFHLVAAFAEERFRGLATTLHGVGTAALGAGIFLTGQIFNLAEHWPTGVLLWAFGAVIAWRVRPDWVQAAFTAVLVPAWVVSEWSTRTELWHYGDRVQMVGMLSLAITYLSLRDQKKDSIRTALSWMGGLAVIPLAIITALASSDISRWGSYGWRNDPRYAPSSLAMMLAWACALILPVVFAYAYRRSAAWMNGVAAVWALAMVYSTLPYPDAWFGIWLWNALAPYVFGLAGSIGMVLWGLREQRKERINIGMAGCALSVLLFYFSNVMDKMGRSAALMVGGLMFLIVGWSMEKTRRKLVARITGGAR